MSTRRKSPNDAKAFQRALTQFRLINEIHFLLWRAPFQNQNSWDAGWMCREHALIVASLGALSTKASNACNPVCHCTVSDSPAPLDYGTGEENTPGKGL
jgi:hypothetical protein